MEPCPGCKTKGSFYQEENEEGKKFLRCPICGYETPRFNNHNEAETFWNMHYKKLHNV